MQGDSFFLCLLCSDLVLLVLRFRSVVAIFGKILASPQVTIRHFIAVKVS